jgi:glycine/D-amino acid oxidase-like deaminating enzyme
MDTQRTALQLEHKELKQIRIRHLMTVINALFSFPLNEQTHCRLNTVLFYHGTLDPTTHSVNPLKLTLALAAAAENAGATIHELTKVESLEEDKESGLGWVVHTAGIAHSACLYYVR